MNRSRGRGEAFIVPRALLRRIGTIELAVAIQFLSPALLMIPAMQPLRIPIRVLQYGASLVFLLFYARRSLRGGLQPAAKLLFVCLAVMLANLLQPSTQWVAGTAQIVFQLCILAPLFWGSAMVNDAYRLRRLVWAVLLANVLSAGVGLLQVYYPQLLPGDYSPSFRHNLSMLSYEGAGGRSIMRPPGLTDMPGGAASGGLLCGLLGLILAASPRERRAVRLFALACCLLGITILYLSFVRSFTLALLASFLAVSFVRNRRAAPVRLLRIAALAVVTVIGAYWLAVSIGGESVSQRFNFRETSVRETYQNSRGIFLQHTFANVLPEYPFGAGVGRWGMMCNYFCDLNDIQRPPFYVEIQLTGWIYDGGVPLMLAYLAALGMSMWYSFRVATRHPDQQVAVLAKCILAVQVCLTATLLGGPTFNNLLGSQFWLLAGALFGACRGLSRQALSRPTQYFVQHASAGAPPLVASHGGR